MSQIQVARVRQAPIYVQERAIEGLRRVPFVRLVAEYAHMSRSSTSPTAKANTQTNKECTGTLPQLTSAINNCGARARACRFDGSLDWERFLSREHKGVKSMQHGWRTLLSDDGFLSLNRANNRFCMARY